MRLSGHQGQSMSPLWILAPDGGPRVMTRTARRIVTGHNDQGLSVCLSDGTPPKYVREPRTLIDFVEIWSTEEAPAAISSTQPDPTEGKLRILPAMQGTKFRLNDFHPGHVSRLKPRDDGRHPGMHRTETIDYLIILEGEIYLILDDGELLLRAGDVVVQRGTDHAWENRSDQVARVASILVRGVMSEELRAKLPGLQLRDY